MPLSLETNPLRQGLPREALADPCAFVIFGASGDLTKRKLMPALFSLYCQGMLSQGFAVIGFARTDYTDEQFREQMRQAVERSGQLEVGSCAWEDFASCLTYVSADYDNPEAYRQIGDRLAWSDKEHGTSGNRLIYLAVPGFGFDDIVENLADCDWTKSEAGWRRIIVEKPFGSDLESAKRLNRDLQNVFEEDQIYRIDHYLGKETVQNILVFRFANSLFEPIWNQNYIDHVQITIAETLGVEDRGAFYDKTGAMRDIVQNHALQLLSLVAMEPPASLDADDVRNEKMKVFKSVRRIAETDVHRYAVRGQYGPGLMLGEQVPGYRQEPRVDPNSSTETFVALELYIDNWRWANVPFYIRTGKRLPRRSTEIAVQFKDVPDVLFKKLRPEQVAPNLLTLNVQPEEGIALRAQSKAPGPGLVLRPVQMDFRYGTSFSKITPEAYERLLLDATVGDTSLFARDDATEECWEIITPILNVWQTERAKDFPNYVPGSWGPRESFEMMERSGRRWRRV
jgi:glucose-6-phosphate 1-dehydrogenase